MTSPKAPTLNNGGERRQVMTPEQKHTTYLLRRFFAFPTKASAREMLDDALNEIELAARLTKVTEQEARKSQAESTPAP